MSTECKLPPFLTTRGGVSELVELSVVMLYPPGVSALHNRREVIPAQKLGGMTGRSTMFEVAYLCSKL